MDLTHKLKHLYFECKQSKGKRVAEKFTGKKVTGKKSQKKNQGNKVRVYTYVKFLWKTSAVNDKNLYSLLKLNNFTSYHIGYTCILLYEELQL